MNWTLPPASVPIVAIFEVKKEFRVTFGAERCARQSAANCKKPFVTQSQEKRKMTTRKSNSDVFLLIFVALLAQLFASPVARAQTDNTLSDDKVHVELTPYLVFGGISGDLTIKNQTVPVDVSGGDVLLHLQLGFMARSQISYNRWFAGADLAYVGLGASGLQQVNIGVDQWASEALGGYRPSKYIKGLAGVRYNNITSKFRFQGPLALIRSGSYTWWDPFFGAQGDVPLGKKFGASARFDIGGFGVGSKIAVNAEPLLNYNWNRKFTTSFGWKFFYQDYKNSGKGFEYDLLVQGPFLGFTIRW
jgi:hypothetical protein